jgi:PAS domain S-box-containing protein
MTAQTNKHISALNHYIKKGRFYKTVVEEGSDIIFIVTYDGLILYCNNSAKGTLGYSRNSLINKYIFHFIHPEILDNFKIEFNKCLKKRFSASVEFQFKCKDGTYKFFEFNAINLKHNDGLNGLLLDCRDISQRKRDAEELVRAQKAKELFLANISHEIRTPINGIAGMADLLSQNPSAEDQVLYLKAIKSSAENLKVIINDILDISSIESGKLRFERINFYIEDLLRSLINTFRLQAQAKGISLSYTLASEIPPVFIGDPVRLNQILVNLVGNAIKFTHQGRIHIHTTLHTIKHKDYYLRIDVSDTGIGIPRSKIKKIFESFSQADASVTRKYGGTGLGLTIVKQLVEMQRGSIKVVSKENEGSTFTVIIPYQVGAAEVHQTPSKIAVTMSARIKSASILLVEDNDINRLYASSILKMWGCHFDTAENGQVALEKIKNNHFDLVLMDIQMPVMDGFEATRHIRNLDGRKKNVPVVALTANATQRDIENCISHGMNDCLTKPFTQEDLLRILDKHLGNKIFESGEVRENQNKGTSNHAYLAYLERVSGNNKAFVIEIAETIIQSIPQNLNEISMHMQQKNWNELARVAHKIKPSITLMGLNQLKDRIVSLEEEAKSKKKPELIIELAEEIKDSLTEAVESLKVQLNSYS